MLSDPAKRFDYDFTGIYEIDKYTLRVWTVYFDRILLGLLFSSESHVSVFKGYDNDTKTSWDLIMAYENCRNILPGLKE